MSPSISHIFFYFNDNKIIKHLKKLNYIKNSKYQPYTIKMFHNVPHIKDETLCTEKVTYSSFKFWDRSRMLYLAKLKQT